MAILDLGTYYSELKQLREEYPDSTGTALFEKYANLGNAFDSLTEEGGKVKISLAKLCDELNVIVATPPSKWPETLLGPPIGYKLESNKGGSTSSVLHKEKLEVVSESKGRRVATVEVQRIHMEQNKAAKDAADTIVSTLAEFDRVFTCKCEVKELLRGIQQDLDTLSVLRESELAITINVEMAESISHQIFQLEEFKVSVSQIKAKLGLEFEKTKDRTDKKNQGLTTLLNQYIRKFPNSSFYNIMDYRRLSAIRKLLEMEMSIRSYLDSITKRGQTISQMIDDLRSKEKSLRDAIAKKNELHKSIADLETGITQKTSNFEKFLDRNGISLNRTRFRNTYADVECYCSKIVKVIAEALSDKMTTIRNALSQKRAAVFAVQPPVIELNRQSINKTSLFPPFVSWGHVGVLHRKSRIKENLPFIIDFPFTRHFLVDRIENVNCLLLKMAFAMPLTHFSITVLDQDSAGGNIMDVAGLSDVPGLMQIVTKPDDVGSALRELEDYVSGHTSVFRDGVKSWEEYNDTHPNAPLPYKVLVIFSLAGFDRNMGHLDILRRLISNGNQHGVFLMLYENALKEVDERVSTPLFNALKDKVEKLGRPLFNSEFDRAGRVDFSVFQTDFLSERLPEAASISALINDLKDAAYKLSAPPSRQFSDLLQYYDMWTGDSADGIETTIGWDKEENEVHFRLWDEESHALLGGATGSGKSNLLHVLIMTLCHRYSPDEVSLYLLDYKDGLEFKKYTENGVAWLPHAKTISRSNDPEYALTMFEYLNEERKRRSKIYGHYGKYSDFRKAGNSLPRIIVVIDEFQKIFETDNAEKVAEHMSGLLMQGRAYGIHLILATQTLASLHVKGLAGMLGQIPIRFSLRCNSGDEGILESGNLDAMNIKIPYCIINNNGGRKGQNTIFQLPYIDHMSCEGKTYREHMKRRNVPIKCRVFDGTKLPHIESTASFRNIIGDASKNYDCHLYLGVRNEFLARPFLISFDDSPLGHLLIAGEDGDMGDDGNINGRDIWDGLAESISQSLSCQADTTFLFYNPLDRLTDCIKDINGTRLGKNASEAQLLNELEQLSHSSSKNNFLVVENYDRARMLHPVEETRFRRNAEETNLRTALSVFLSAFSPVEEAPFTVILFVHSFEAIRKSVLQKIGCVNIFAGCPKRIGFNLSPDDMQTLLPRSRKMAGQAKVIFGDERASGNPVSFLPFSLDEARQ